MDRRSGLPGTEPRKSWAVTLDARGMRTDFWPAGARFDVNVTGNALSGMGVGAVASVDGLVCRRRAVYDGLEEQYGGLRRSVQRVL